MSFTNDNEQLTPLVENICDSINLEKCVLILGPGIYVNEVEGRVYDKNEYLSKLAEENSTRKFFPVDGLISFSEKNDKFTIQQQVKKFYSGVGDTQLLETIASVKFPLIINASPDIALYNYLLDNKLEPNIQCKYFEGHQDENKIISFDRDHPLIYNIFGIAFDPQSLIISHKILFQKIQEILPQNSLPNSIRTYLQNASSFLFLGFKFDSWAFQLISYKIIKDRALDDNITRLSSLRNEDNLENSLIINQALGIEITNIPPLQILNYLIKSIKQNRMSHLLRNVGSQDKFSCFISYSRKSESFVSKFITIFRNNVDDMNNKERSNTELQLLYDKKDLSYGQSIDSFMTRIGKGKTVLIVISDAYLKSAYCMTEALRVSEHHKNDERVFYTLIKNDLEIDFGNITDGQNYYYDFWQNKLAELASTEKADTKKILEYAMIRDFVRGFIYNISDANNLIANIDQLNDEMIGSLAKEIIKKMKEEL